jgi:kynurenine formamidase
MGQPILNSAIAAAVCVCLPVCWIAAACSEPPVNAFNEGRFGHVVDLTHALSEDTPYIPVPGVTFPFKQTPIATLSKNGVAANRWEIHEHLGTQIDARIQDAKAFVNRDASGVMHFPGFSAEAATFLARSRDVSGLGVDTQSLDPGPDTAYAAHNVWLATGKWAVELVANLRNVPPSGATVFVGASKVTGATGGPVRLIAVW